MVLEDAQYIVFRVGKEEFGLSIHHVVSIERLQPVTTVPNMPKYMAGLIDLRGAVTPVIDLRKIFEQDHQDQEKTRILVVKVEDTLIGFIVDDATDVLAIPADSIQHPKIAKEVDLAYFLGISKLNERMIILLDAHVLLQNFTLLESLKELEKLEELKEAI